MSEGDDPLDHLALDLNVLVGLWADLTYVHRGRDEFTIDFIRRVPEPRGRVLVARAVLAPIVAIEFSDQLSDAWRAYNRWSMPGTES